MAVPPSASAYDIFISYRHNDNLDGWVTEFVQHLEKELRATFKEPLTVYFDKSPIDGLLETHSVDKSLHGKLNCRILIPIVSQTYCDTNSFAWRSEFCAFNALASGDTFGRDIKLSNGNVASRILPVKIHDIDGDDIKILEKEIGGSLRSIEFIYREPGVNRPLRSNEEHPTRNAAQTVYRNQVNKVAQATKQIITAMKDPGSESNVQQGQKPQVARRGIRKALLASAVVLTLIALSYFVATRVGPVAAGDEIDKSIAVLAFVNMSNDPEQEFLSDGISEEVLNLLAKVPELKVIGRTSSFYFKDKNEDLRTIGEKLGAAHILEGSVRKEGNQVRITAQLIRASDGVHLWSNTYDRKLEKIFDLQDEIAAAVLKELKLKLLGTSHVSGMPMPNTEAYSLIQKGNYFADQRNIPLATEYYSQSLALDSGNARAWSNLAYLKILEGNSVFEKFEPNYAMARKMAARALALDPSAAEARRMVGIFKMWYDFDWQGAEMEFNNVLELEPGNSSAFRSLGQLYRAQGLYQKGFDQSMKSMVVNPLNVVTICSHADVLSNLGRFDEAIQVFKAGMEINDAYVRPRLLNMYLVTGDYDLIAPIFESMRDSEKSLVAPMVWYALGDSKKMEKAVQEMLRQHASGSMSSYDVATNLAFLNRKDLALDYLEKAVGEKYRCVFIKSNLLMKSLFDEPRFHKVLKGLNLSAV